MRPGDVVWVEFSPARDREQSGRRPAVVISSEDHLAAATTLVTVVPGTSRARGWPNHVPLTGATGLTADGPTLAMTEQVRTISRSRVVRASGRVAPECLDEILGWVHRWLA